MTPAGFTLFVFSRLLNQSMCRPTYITGLTSSLATSREVIGVHLKVSFQSWLLLLCFPHSVPGEEAIKAKNVFYYLTYTGAVDLESIHEPRLRKVSRGVFLDRAMSSS